MSLLPTLPPADTAKAIDLSDGVAAENHDVLSMGVLGDWLLTFGGDSQTLPKRVAELPWSPVLKSDDWSLWGTETADGWRGMPHLTLERGPWFVWLIGELYDTDEPEETILDVLDGRVATESLNGHFVVVAWHRTSEQWHILTNRYATLHAYLAQDDSRVALGSFFPAVAAAAGRTDLDWDGLATLFGFGFFAGDRTHLCGVRILRPATHICLDRNGRLVDESTYWHWWHQPDLTRSYEDTVDEFAQRLAAVMSDMTAGGRIALPISGGLDSRSTVAALPMGDPMDHLWAYSYGYSDDSAETRIGRRVAAARGMAFDAYTITPYLFAELPQITAAIEGFEDVTQCRQAAIVSPLGQHADYVVAAHWGDVLLGDVGLADGHMGLLDEQAFLETTQRKFLKGGSSWLLANLYERQSAGSAPDSLFRASLSDQLQRVPQIDDPDFRLKAIKTNLWSARWTTTALRMYTAAAFPRLPFYDNRLVDFFCTVPTAMVRGRQLQIDYLRRYAPDLAKITWQVTGQDLFHDGRTSYTGLAARVMSRGVRTLQGQKILERNWEVQFAGPQGRQGLNDWLLSPGLLLHNFVEPQVVAALLSAFRSDPYTDKRGYTVSMLLSFSAWLELHYRPLLGGQ